MYLLKKVALACGSKFKWFKHVVRFYIIIKLYLKSSLKKKFKWFKGKCVQ